MLLLVIQDCPPSLSFPCQCTAKESSENAATLYSTAGLCSTTPSANIPEAPELGTPRYNGQNVEPCPYYVACAACVWFTVEPSITDTMAYERVLSNMHCYTVVRAQACSCQQSNAYFEGISLESVPCEFGSMLSINALVRENCSLRVNKFC